MSASRSKPDSEQEGGDDGAGTEGDDERGLDAELDLLRPPGELAHEQLGQSERDGEAEQQRQRQGELEPPQAGRALEVREEHGRQHAADRAGAERDEAPPVFEASTRANDCGGSS